MIKKFCWKSDNELTNKSSRFVFCVYANLDIATAKATKEEQSRAKHHLLDVATPNEPFTVVHFRNKALPILENLLAQGKSPIVVGGTNYYIESLLWDILVSPTDCSSNENLSKLPASATPPPPSTLADKAKACTSGNVNDDADDIVATVSGNVENSSFIAAEKMLTMSSELLHNHLRNIDPETANRIHPNNKRKIMRAIEFYQQTGQTLSSKLNEQRQQPGGNRLGGPLRYPHTILLWLRCNQDVLNKRLDKRVDAMLEQGLLREIRAFHNEHNVNNSISGNTCDTTSTSASVSSSSSSNYTKGVLQTIGFKEFIPYLEQFNAANDQKIETYLQANAYKMPTEEQFKSYASSINEVHDAEAVNLKVPKDHLPPGLDVLNSCLNELKLVTRRYSKKQIKWINNRFLASRDRQVPDLYELDTSDVGQWHERVYSPAVNIIDAYRNGQMCEIEPMQKRQHPGAGLNEETSNFCTVCERHFIGEYQWQLHLKSNKHKKRKEGLRKKTKTLTSMATNPPQNLKE
ncbi:tRNA dimethylallyltransferase isoform X2 [Lucilia cuprina]|uniref:tRNA dimethylallyltransferase isoform X2 n=1 Tax=Lucilia cuprina TaxID=7375 RepID=UPI001F0550D4|nr:tRNA dimethylallyltransferase isoform X2 [Lucilia cuprina]